MAVVLSDLNLGHFTLQMKKCFTKELTTETLFNLRLFDQSFSPKSAGKNLLEL